MRARQCAGHYGRRASCGHRGLATPDRITVCASREVLTTSRSLSIVSRISDMSIIYTNRANVVTREENDRCPDKAL